MSIASYFGGLWRAAIGDNQNRDPLSDFWYQAVTVMSNAGVAVTAENAMKVPAVFACLQVLAKPVGSLPFYVFRKSADGSKQMLPEHPVARMFYDGPNDEDTGFDWRGQMQWDLGLYKNAYSRIRPIRGAARTPFMTFFSALERIHPSLIHPERSPDGKVIYRHFDQLTGTQEILSRDEVFHLKALPLTADGLAGVPVVQTGTGRDIIGSALALQEFTGRFFANDTKPGPIIKNPGTFKSDLDRDRYIEAVKRARTGRNAWAPLVLEFGFDFVANEINAEKSQMNETRVQLANEIAQIWGVPPHKIGLLDKATNNNIEQQALEFVIDCLAPWLVLWEHRIKKDLILEDDVYCEFDVLPLLRGDLKSRYEAFAIARNWGWMSANDVLRMEGRNPIPGGDEYLKPLNMAPSSGERAPAPPPSGQQKAPPPKDGETGGEAEPAGPTDSGPTETPSPSKTDAESRAAAFAQHQAEVVSIAGRRLHSVLGRVA
jgi:HK97 family phage portal protein